MRFRTLQIFSIAALLGTASLTTWASQRLTLSPDEAVSLQPAVDLNCALSPEARASRLKFVREQLQVEIHNLGIAHRVREDVQAALDAMNFAYDLSRACKLTSDAASFAAGYGSLKAALGAKEVVTVAGRVVPLLVGQAVTLQSLLKNAELTEGSLEEGFKSRVTRVLGRPLSLDDSLEFLTSPTCTNGKCNIQSLEVKALNKELDHWFSVSTKKHEDASGWSVFEAYHQDYGRKLANLDLPYATGKVLLKNLQIAHLEVLKMTLLQDQLACDSIE